jgi:hypothetical protein
MTELDAALERLETVARADTQVLDEPAGKALLRAVGIATPGARLVETAADAVAGPLVTAAAASEAAGAMQQRHDAPLLVEQWLDDGVQCFAGLSLDGGFGPVLSVGLGGIWVEILEDVAHRSAPLTGGEAAEMIESLRGAAVLASARGQAGADLDALAETLVKLGELAREPRVRALVSTIEVNPLLATASGPPVALDCTVVLRDPGAAAESPAARSDEPVDLRPCSLPRASPSSAPRPTLPSPATSCSPTSSREAFPARSLASTRRPPRSWACRATPRSATSPSRSIWRSSCFVVTSCFRPCATAPRPACAPS